MRGSHGPTHLMLWLFHLRLTSLSPTGFSAIGDCLNSVLIRSYKTMTFGSLILSEFINWSSVRKVYRNSLGFLCNYLISLKVFKMKLKIDKVFNFFYTNSAVKIYLI